MVSAGYFADQPRTTRRLTKTTLRLPKHSLGYAQDYADSGNAPKQFPWIDRFNDDLSITSARWYDSKEKLRQRRTINALPWRRLGARVIMHPSLFSNSEPNDGAQVRGQGEDGRFFVARGADRHGSLRTPNATTFPVALFSCASNGAVIDYKGGAALLWGRHPDKYLPNQWDRALERLGVDGSALPKYERFAAVAFRTAQDVLGIETIRLRPDGSARHVVA